MALGSHYGEMMPYKLFNITASFHHDGNLGPYNLFNMTASFHCDGNLEPYNLFNMTANDAVMLNKLHGPMLPSW
jgi:hypothetical protein